MSSQALEQMLSSVPGIGQEDTPYQTLDVYTSGLSQMYTGPMKSNDFFPTTTGFGINGPKIDGIDDYHETFKVDRYDNLYKAHSTFSIGKKKKSIFYDD